jgi:hypothetical protein
MVCILFLLQQDATVHQCSLGLIGHLKHFPTMYWLYCVLKDWAEPPMAKEIGFASGKTVLDQKSNAEYLKKLEAATESIQKAFAMQETNAVVCLTALFFL